MSYVLLVASLLPAQDPAPGPAVNRLPLIPRGHLLIAGGGPTTTEICKKALEVAGGADAPLVIVPQASAVPPLAGQRSAQLWQAAGAKNVSILDMANLKAADEMVNQARLIWMPGGDQNRLMQALAKTGIPEAIRRRFVDGAVVGGTSAGAAVMSQCMIAGGPGSDPNTPVTPVLSVGLGLMPEAIIDQHFSRRNRFGRLVGAVLVNPDLIGVGIDESTAILVSGRSFEVIGKSQVFVYDARPLKEKGKPKGDKQTAQALQPRVLQAGMKFSLDLIDSPLTSKLAEKPARAD